MPRRGHGRGGHAGELVFLLLSVGGRRGGPEGEFDVPAVGGTGYPWVILFFRPDFSIADEPVALLDIIGDSLEDSKLPGGYGAVLQP